MMQNLRLWRLLKPEETLSQIIIACVVSLVLGLAIVGLSPLVVLVIVGGIAGVLLFLKRPEVGVLGILVLTGSIVFEDTLPLVPIPVGSLHIPDVILLALFGVLILRLVVEDDFKFVRTPLDIPVAAYVGIMLVASVLGLVAGRTEFNLAFREIRVQSYFLLLFVVTNLIREKRQLVWLIRGFFGVAMLVAAVMIAQFILGDSMPLLPGRVEVLNTEGQSFSGITRILPPGQGLVLVGAITLLVVLVFERLQLRTFGRLMQVGMLMLAVIMTFNRNFWVAVGLALVLLFLVTRQGDRGRYLQWIVLGAIVLSIFLVVVFSVPDMPFANLIGAAFDRFASLFEADTFQAQDSSFRWRDIEYQYAVPQVLAHPLFGLGMGARYRPFTTLDYTGFDGRAYMHNGHLWIMVKVGLLGYGALAAAAGLFMWRVYTHWHQLPGPMMRGLLLGFFLTFVGVVIGLIVNPMITQWGWTTNAGIMWGISEVIILRAKEWGPLEIKEEIPLDQAGGTAA